MMRMVILDDNEPAPGLRNMWGLSIYVEYDRLRILFDADSDPGVLEYNSDRLGIDLSRLDFGFLSHRHSDHSGGYRYVAEVKPGLRVYVPIDALHVFDELMLEPILVGKARLLARGVWSTGSLSSNGLYEHGMILEAEAGPILFVGCSHPGVEVLADKALEVVGSDKLHMVIGGFHNPSRKQLDLLAEKTEYICPIHCSGERAKSYIREKYPSKYCIARTGSTIVITDKKPLIKY